MAKAAQERPSLKQAHPSAEVGGVTNVEAKVPSSSTDAPPQMQELFLPVHGHVNLFAEEVAVIDHPSFQRLRRVRQLGFAHIVFPGGVHTRFEHSIGAVHVAQFMINHVNSNFNKYEPVVSDWHKIKIDDHVARLIRLGALLHDIGHLPFGHTLEDELNHLRSHDGPDRLETIAKRKFFQYDLYKAVGSADKPHGGWSLRELINELYKGIVKTLGVDLEPFAVLCAIITKPPKQDGETKTNWLNTAKELENKIHLQVCRDIVGDTICADFLDYLFRDWHHLGKSLYQDERLYQYMEARERVRQNGSESRFVINVGPADRVRHDALTNILELLEGRYKLAEVVLFHRTKLAVTALLDRCLLEIRDLHREVGMSVEEFLDTTELLLLDGSDDALPEILLHLAEGGSEAGRDKLRRRIEADRATITEAVKPTNDDLLGSDIEIAAVRQTELELRVDRIKALVDRLRDRRVYTLAYKLKIGDFTGAHAHKPENLKLKRVIQIYGEPENRQKFLNGIEALCHLPQGSVLMYCPPSAAMNAKIAKVNLLIEGEVIPFDEYDKDGDESSLTRGALWAQIRRFYELWGAQVYLDRVTWEELTVQGQNNLRAVLQDVFFSRNTDTDPNIVRQQVEASIRAVREERPRLAAREASSAPESDRFDDFVFPSGLPFGKVK
jgi:HD superfamily phosphohydrolase